MVNQVQTQTQQGVLRHYHLCKTPGARLSGGLQIPPTLRPWKATIQTFFFPLLHKLARIPHLRLVFPQSPPCFGLQPECLSYKSSTLDTGCTRHTHHRQTLCESPSHLEYKAGLKEKMKMKTEKAHRDQGTRASKIPLPTPITGLFFFPTL